MILTILLSLFIDTDIIINCRLTIDKSDITIIFLRTWSLTIQVHPNLNFFCLCIMNVVLGNGAKFNDKVFMDNLCHKLLY